MPVLRCPQIAGFQLSTEVLRGTHVVTPYGAAHGGSADVTDLRVRFHVGEFLDRVAQTRERLIMPPLHRSYSSQEPKAVAPQVRTAVPQADQGFGDALCPARVVPTEPGAQLEQADQTRPIVAVVAWKLRNENEAGGQEPPPARAVRQAYQPECHRVAGHPHSAQAGQSTNGVAISSRRPPPAPVAPKGRHVAHEDPRASVLALAGVVPATPRLRVVAGDGLGRHTTRSVQIALIWS